MSDILILLRSLLQRAETAASLTHKVTLSLSHIKTRIDRPLQRLIAHHCRWGLFGPLLEILHKYWNTSPIEDPGASNEKCSAYKLLAARMCIDANLIRRSFEAVTLLNQSSSKSYLECLRASYLSAQAIKGWAFSFALIISVSWNQRRFSVLLACFWRGNLRWQNSGRWFQPSRIFSYNDLC